MLAKSFHAIVLGFTDVELGGFAVKDDVDNSVGEVPLIGVDVAVEGSGVVDDSFEDPVLDERYVEEFF